MGPRERKVARSQSSKQEAKPQSKSSWALPPLKTYKECPYYLQDNEFIIGGYRVNISVKQSLRSIFALHNETGNIHTHFWGSVLYSVLFYRIFIQHVDIWGNPIPNLSIGDYSIFLTLYLANMATFCGSTTFHLFMSLSSDWYFKLCKLDYIGISTTIAGSGIPLVYFFFGCHEYWRDTYITALGVLGTLSVAMSLHPVFQQPKYRNIRATVFTLAAVSVFIPVAHASIELQLEGEDVAWFVHHCLGVLAVYGVGVIFYTGRIPERWSPGDFDVGPHSHQFFHIFQTTGAIYLLQVILELYRHRTANPCKVA